MKFNKRKTKNFFENLALFLANRSIFVFFIFIFICTIIAFLIFNFYVARVIEEEFEVSKTTSTVNYDLYDEVINNWKESKTEIDFDEDFLNSEENKEESEKDEEDETEEKEDDVNDNSSVADDNLSAEELESELASTLFELYEFTDGELPSLSERSIVWEDLNLGDSEDYSGTYSQNIKFLEKLKEEVKDK